MVKYEYKKPVKHVPGTKHRPGTIVQMKNGALAEVGSTGKWTIIKGASNAKMAAMRKLRSKTKRNISKRSATIAFNRFYAERPYATDATRAAAKKRDRCVNSRKISKTTKYRSAPHRWDYPGLDDGSNRTNCTGSKFAKKHNVTKKQMEGLFAARKARTGKKPTAAMKKMWASAK